MTLQALHQCEHEDRQGGDDDSAGERSDQQSAASQGLQQDREGESEHNQNDVSQKCLERVEAHEIGH